MTLPIPTEDRWSCLSTSLARKVLAAALLGAVGHFTLTVSAQARDPVAARALFQEARRAADAGQYPLACPKFSDSYRLDPAVGTLLNIADCEQRLGRVATAWVTFQRALDQLSKDDDRRPSAERAAAALEPRLPRLTIRLGPAAPPGSTVQRDGVDVGSSGLGVALPLDPGRHVVAVRAPGRREQRYELDLAEAQSREVVGEPGPVEPPAPVAPIPPRTPAQTQAPVPPPPAASSAPAPRVLTVAPVASAPVQGADRNGGGSRMVGYVLGGIGLVGLVVGGVTRGAAFSQQSTIDSHCDALKACDSVGLDAVSKAKTLQTVSTVALVAGAAGVGTGIYLLVAGRGRSAPQARIYPLISPEGIGVGVLRRF
jgi:hypothetical protein